MAAAAVAGAVLAGPDPVLPALAAGPLHRPGDAPLAGAVDAPLAGAEGPLRSVSIAVAALDCFARRPELGATGLARELGIAKSTACRMLAALAAGGMLERAGGGRYRLGMRVFELGLLAAERAPVREAARPELLALHAELRDIVQLGVPVSGHVLYVDRHGGPDPGQRLSGETLRRVPGYSSSAGRAMAAFDPGLRAQTLAVPRRRHTPFTIVAASRLEQVLASARQTGWASSREELEPGYSSVGAPVLARVDGRPRPVAAISVVGPTARILGARKDFVVASICRAAHRASERLAQIAEG